EAIAAIAQRELSHVVAEIGVTEQAVQGRVIRALNAAELVFDHPPVVAFGPGSAIPHYESGHAELAADRSCSLISGEVGPAASPPTRPGWAMRAPSRPRRCAGCGRRYARRATPRSRRSGRPP